MDINFHYFAVKTIAIKAGFEEEEAQLISAYSQFVDDYNLWGNYGFKEIPEYAASLKTGKKVGSYWIFYTVTTGFESIADMARLMIEKYQREVVVPYHFIPVKKLKELPEGRENYRTKQAKIDGSEDHLASNLLLDAMRKCMDSSREKEHRYDLIRLGVLLHVFADTYAHEGFSGFHGWENRCYINSITDPRTGEIIKDDHDPDYYATVYSVGHAEAGHAPDMTYAYIDYNFATDSKQENKKQYKGNTNRNNKITFLYAAYQIFCVLYKICHDAEPTEEQWNELSRKLEYGFELRGTDFDTLAHGWSFITNNKIKYEYNKDEIWSDQLKASIPSEDDIPLIAEGDEDDAERRNIFGFYDTASDDFFHFNLIAKEIRDAVIE